MSGILNLREGLYLIDGEFLQFGTHFEFLDFDDLDSNNLICFLVDCFVNLTELTLSNDVV